MIRWVKNRRKKYLDIIDDVIEAPSEYPKLFRLMANYKMKLLRVQRLVKNFLAIKRARKQVLHSILTNYVSKARLNERMVNMAYKAFIKKFMTEGSLNLFSDKKVIETLLRSRIRKK